MRRAFLLTTILATIACGSASAVPDSGTGTDAGNGGNVDAGFDAGPSVCGFPGDTGNAYGVGKYCLQLSDCPTTAPICSDINNNANTPAADTFFCVLPCNVCSPAGYCGTGASCVCQSPGECGCVPDTCFSIFPDGGNGPCETADGGSGLDGGHDGGTDGG